MLALSLFVRCEIGQVYGNLIVARAVDTTKRSKRTFVEFFCLVVLS